MQQDQQANIRDLLLTIGVADSVSVHRTVIAGNVGALEPFCVVAEEYDPAANSVNTPRRWINCKAKRNKVRRPHGPALNSFKASFTY
jgi:hypothetical protein